MSATAPVTAIVPLFNGGRFIRQAIQSMLAQELRPREIVVVDDGSTDGGAALIAGCPGVRILRQPNAGEAAARNRGIEAAREPLIAFLDQDDLWTPRKLALQVAVLDADASVDVVFGRHRLFVEDGAQWFRRDLLGEILVARLPGTLLVRRSAVERIGPFREDLRLGSDVDWIWRAGDAGIRFHLVEEEVLLRRLHGSNASMDRPLFSRGLIDAAHAALKRRRVPGCSLHAGAQAGAADAQA